MIEKMTADTLSHFCSMGVRLWPDTTEKELAEDNAAVDENKWAVYFYKTGKEYSGFILVSIRQDYVEGSQSSPVAYIEGLYVEENHRRKGIAGALVKAAEAWGREKGCTEIGSDCELSNQLSIDFHLAAGFTEAERVVCFIKPLES